MKRESETRRSVLRQLTAAGLGAGVGGASLLASAGLARAKSAARIRSEVAQAREEMFRRFPVTRSYDQQAAATLIIPRIVKAAFVVGGSYGEGAMMVGGEIESFWSYASASFGFQAGAQETNQALFFMTSNALGTFLDAEGLEFGADAEVSLLDQGAELAVDTTKDTKPVIGVVFGRGGLMAGASLQGGKYTRIQP
ncbi:MAG: lipid-binding SYLF domain-containing protein [Pseudomonadota bacterium]